MKSNHYNKAQCAQLVYAHLSFFANKRLISEVIYFTSIIKFLIGKICVCVVKSCKQHNFK